MKIATLAFLVFLPPCGFAQIHASSPEVDAVYPAAYALYLDIHQHPELSSQEFETAVKMATRLRELGYEVTEHVGGTGVVAVMRNGAGPTIMLRTELDALPVEEKTGLSYASKVRVKDRSGQEVPVMCTPVGTIYTWPPYTERQPSWRTQTIPGTARLC
jgi:hippurate hydrolase